MFEICVSQCSAIRLDVFGTTRELQTEGQQCFVLAILCEEELVRFFLGSVHFDTWQMLRSSLASLSGRC